MQLVDSVTVTTWMMAIALGTLHWDEQLNISTFFLKTDVVHYLKIVVVTQLVVN